MSTPHITLNQINTLPHAQAVALLTGLYEHSDWIAAQALDERPFASAAALKHAMVKVLHDAGREPQLALVRAHPELAGKAMVSQSLTTESAHEQAKAGLNTAARKSLRTSSSSTPATTPSLVSPLSWPCADHGARA